jgi:hypothetical protein
VSRSPESLASGLANSRSAKSQNGEKYSCGGQRESLSSGIRKSRRPKSHFLWEIVRGCIRVVKEKEGPVDRFDSDS